MSRKGISKERIIEVALQIADRDGLDHLTMHGIARELGIKTPSLYKHVSSMEEIFNTLHLAGLNHLVTLSDEISREESSEKQIHHFVRIYLDFAHNTPGLYQAMQRSHIMDDPDVKEAGERLLRILFSLFRDFPLTEMELIHTVRSLRSMLHGFLDLKQRQAFKMPGELSDSVYWAIDLVLYALKNKSP